MSLSPILLSHQAFLFPAKDREGKDRSYSACSFWCSYLVGTHQRHVVWGDRAWARDQNSWALSRVLPQTSSMTLNGHEISFLRLYGEGGHLVFFSYAETEAWRRGIICSMAHDWLVAQLGLTHQTITAMLFESQCHASPFSHLHDGHRKDGRWAQLCQWWWRTWEMENI